VFSFEACSSLIFPSAWASGTFASWERNRRSDWMSCADVIPVLENVECRMMATSCAMVFEMSMRSLTRWFQRCVRRQPRQPCRWVLDALGDPLACRNALSALTFVNCLQLSCATTLTAAVPHKQHLARRAKRRNANSLHLCCYCASLLSPTFRSCTSHCISIPPPLRVGQKLRD
jgi:hypothetical protein